jgi:hypothetical protein
LQCRQREEGFRGMKKIGSTHHWGREASEIIVYFQLKQYMF